MDHKITKLLFLYLSNMNKESWLAFQQGLYLNRDEQHAITIGQLELASKIITLNDDHTVLELEDLMNNG